MGTEETEVFCVRRCGGPRRRHKIRVLGPLRGHRAHISDQRGPAEPREAARTCDELAAARRRAGDQSGSHTSHTNRSVLSACPLSPPPV